MRIKKTKRFVMVHKPTNKKVVANPTPTNLQQFITLVLNRKGWQLAQCKLKHITNTLVVLVVVGCLLAACSSKSYPCGNYSKWERKTTFNK